MFQFANDGRKMLVIHNCDELLEAPFQQELEVAVFDFVLPEQENETCRLHGLFEANVILGIHIMRDGRQFLCIWKVLDVIDQVLDEQMGDQAHRLTQAGEFFLGRLSQSGDIVHGIVDRIVDQSVDAGVALAACGALGCGSLAIVPQ
jgi:hypothetical protein